MEFILYSLGHSLLENRHNNGGCYHFWRIVGPIKLSWGLVKEGKHEFLAYLDNSQTLLKPLTQIFILLPFCSPQSLLPELQFFKRQLYSGIIDKHRSIFKVYNLVSFDICIPSWNHHYNQMNRSIILKFSHVPLNFFPIPLCLPHLSNHWSIFCHDRFICIF